MNALLSILVYFTVLHLVLSSSPAAFNSKLDAIKSHHLRSSVGFPKEIAHLKAKARARVPVVQLASVVDRATGDVNSDSQKVAKSCKIWRQIIIKTWRQVIR